MTVVKIIALIGIAWFVSVYLVIPWYSAVATIDSALGELARAESAQTPDEVIYHVTLAKQQLPESGSVSWWSSQKGDFKSVQTELDSIISRAMNISSLESGNELFISEMFAIHAKLQAIEETLV